MNAAQTKTIETLATKCATEAKRQAGGQVWLGQLPLPADWDALVEWLGRSPSAHEQRSFERAYFAAYDAA